MSSHLALLPLFPVLVILTATLLPMRLHPLAALPALALLGILFLPPADREAMALQWLQGRYDRSAVTTDLNPRGIIILGGGMAAYRVDRSTGASLETHGRSGRISAAGDLAKTYPGAKVVYAGRGEGPVLDVLADLGIQSDRIIVEEESANTYENARNTARILAPAHGETWILVTSAFHMPRAVATFNRAGFDVVPFPVDYRQPPAGGSNGPAQGPARGSDQAASQGLSSVARQELMALAWYVATGRASLPSLFQQFPS